MRKIFVMLVFCGMVSLASATVDIYITDSAGNSSIELSPLDSVNLYLWYSGDDIISFETVIAATGPGTLSATVWAADDYDPAVAAPNITATGRTIDYDMVSLVLDYTDPENPVEIPNCYNMTAAADSGGLGQGLANPLAYVTFQCDGASPPDVVITLTDWATYYTNWAPADTVMHGMTITQLPEPATIVLLSLGGLLLKRKK